jgi:hypothetical protein
MENPIMYKLSFLGGIVQNKWVLLSQTPSHIKSEKKIYKIKNNY